MRILVFTVAFIGLINITSAQVVKGRITSENDELLIGVHIANVSSGSHAHSNELGEFYIERTNEGDSLMFEYIGYQSVIIVLQSRDDIEVEMKSTPLLLKEINVDSDLDPLNLTSRINNNLQNLRSSQEILRIVPGLFTGQHAGGGKAEQLFVRGFDLDHGTDLAISVDGMPVNMVSHAHGQGYSDLHFVIPELIDVVSFTKGPHESSAGNFATAGQVEIKLKDKLESNAIKTEIGMFNSRRLVGLFDLLDDVDHQNAYVAFEHKVSDGPFESPQLFNRTNAILKYQRINPSRGKFGIGVSYFTSNWQASGQIPQRAVQEEMISRFGAIDDTEGGQTSRASIQIEHFKQLSKQTFIKSDYYASNYKFNLFSNFTFFLRDSINGDQIQQKENRVLYGGRTTVVNSSKLAGSKWINSMEIGFRQDNAQDVMLANTLNRAKILSYEQFGDISELNSFISFSSTLNRGKWIINPSVRYDAFSFTYHDQLSTEYSRLNNTEAVVSPKLSLSYTNKKASYFIRSSYGFHSNDARLMLEDLNKPLLAKAWGTDIGAVLNLRKGVLAHLTLWHLRSEEELVYVGDAGIVENNGASERKGVELSLRWQVLKNIVLSSDISYTHARGLEGESGSKFIPLAPSFTHMLNLDLIAIKGFNSRISLRSIGDRPANEDFTITAKGYNVVDAKFSYDLGRIQIQLSALNIFDVDWNETQFATESRLVNEAESVEEIHFTPGTPLFVQLGLKFSF